MGRRQKPGSKSGFVKLANDVVEFSFEGKTGSLAQIRDKRSGRKFLSVAEGARLFRLIIPTESWTSRCADSHESRRPEMKLAGETLTICFEDVLCQGKPTGIKVEVTVRLPAGSAEAVFSLRLENGSDVDIQEVRFPWVGGFKGIEGPGKDWITIENEKLDVHKLLPQRNPHTFCRWRERKTYEFPFLPYLDVSCGAGGLSYICYLEKRRTGALGFERLDPFGERPSLSWSYAASPFVKPGKSWQSPEVGIAVHGGDWHETARRFRNWADTWWKNPSPPASLKNSIGIMNLQFTSFDGTEFFRFSDLPRLAKECAKSGIYHICLWHKAGGLYCNKGDFKEIMDEPEDVLEELRQALAQVRKIGVNMSIILNLRLIRSTMGPYREIGESEAIRGRDGSTYRESYPASHYHLANLGPLYEIGDAIQLCQRPDSPFAERGHKLIEKMLNLGFTSIFIDQPLNNYCCFAENHGHPSPDETSEGAIRFMADVSKQVKQRSKDGYVIGELPEMFQTENVDLWWYWQWRYMRPEVYRYSMPDSLQMWVIDGDVGELNRAFAMGFYANITPAGMEKGLSARPGVASQCAALAKLREQTAAWTVDCRFFDKDGLDFKAAGSAEAYVFAGKERASVIIAETAGRPASVNLTFRPSTLGLKLDSPGAIHRLGGKKVKAPAPKRGVHRLTLSLPRYGAAVWTFGS